ncbi:MAG: aspartate dehydrogenase [Beijerinckiaceae bacterium]
MRLGLIGHGAVARQALAAMAKEAASPLEALIALARRESASKALDALTPYKGALFNEIIIATDIAELIAAKPAVAAEAAGHAAVAEFGPALLASGVDFVITSAGALASAKTRAALDEAARNHRSNWDICAGAVGGLDILAAARLSGIAEVLYTSRKPPMAWRGTPAEAFVDLQSITQPVTFYEGSADAAARDYPQNANVAATIALMGAGFERTRVRLVADPDVTRNVHEIAIRSGCADVEIKIAGKPSPDNPKTSLTTGYALAAHLIHLNRRP